MENACMLLSSAHAVRIYHLNNWPARGIVSWSMGCGVNRSKDALVPAADNTRAADHERALVTAPCSIVSVMFKNAEERFLILFARGSFAL